MTWLFSRSLRGGGSPHSAQPDPGASADAAAAGRGARRRALRHSSQRGPAAPVPGPRPTWRLGLGVSRRHPDQLAAHEHAAPWRARSQRDQRHAVGQGYTSPSRRLWRRRPCTSGHGPGQDVLPEAVGDGTLDQLSTLGPAHPAPLPTDPGGLPPRARRRHSRLGSATATSTRARATWYFAAPLGCRGPRCPTPTPAGRSGWDLDAAWRRRAGGRTRWFTASAPQCLAARDQPRTRSPASPRVAQVAGRAKLHLGPLSITDTNGNVSSPRQLQDAPVPPRWG
jgi:hypothetical protein